MITDTDSIRGITTYTYDNNDNILSVSGPSGNIGFTYTGRDMVEIVTIGSDTHTFSYDGNGNVSTFTDPRFTIKKMVNRCSRFYVQGSTLMSLKE